MQRYNVTDMRGIATRSNAGRVFDAHSTRKTLAASTVRQRVAAMRQWANGTYDSFDDSGDMQTLRVVTAIHYVTGVPNVRQLRVWPVA